MKKKKFFDKPHNLLFIMSAVLFLQFLMFVIYYFMQVIVYQAIDDSIYFVYIPYCLAIYVVSAVFVIKKREENKNINPVKLWFSGFFLYAFCEILIFIKLTLEFEENREYAYSLFDNQPLYKLYLCVSVIFLIYCVLYVLGKKKIYVIFASLNLILFSLFILLMPDMAEFLLEGEESVFEIIVVMFVREAGTLLLMLNTFIFALYELYNYKEK